MKIWLSIHYDLLPKMENDNLWDFVIATMIHSLEKKKIFQDLKMKCINLFISAFITFPNNETLSALNPS